MKLLKNRISKLAGKYHTDLPNVRVRVQDLQADLTGGGDVLIRLVDVVADTGDEVEERLPVLGKLNQIEHHLRILALHVLHPAGGDVPGTDVAVVPFSGRDRRAGVQLLAQGKEVVGRGARQVGRAGDNREPGVVIGCLLREALHPAHVHGIDRKLVNVKGVGDGVLLVGEHEGAPLLRACGAPLALKALVLHISRRDGRPSRLN